MVSIIENESTTKLENENSELQTKTKNRKNDIIICPSRRVIRSAAKVRQYCSDQCLVKSAYFSKQLGSEALHLKFSTGTFQSKQKLEVLPLDLNLNR
ncbi:hypothetical protein AX774_g1462 [Zancudomyces culisetae]|uniref:Uncharacterized protein n=1 Tax=Zancudomyces culisetae TaxID=1213189 RepID=A0A1R1PVN6_ZANCU|nr:hypothetical protein AX774_g1462 [Zancudomyces culisetae]|eukprot:OMH85013.1 hypothetical protein AX774_g1462 [Zancudomyces culisetae]